MNQPFNPYQHNVNIIRGFFRKPLVLITAITFCFTSIFAIISPILTFMATKQYVNSSSEFNYNISLDIVTLFFAVILFILFFMSRSKKPFIKLYTPIKVARIVCIVFTVLSAISLGLVLILLLLLAIFSSNFNPELLQIIFLSLLISLIGTSASFLLSFSLCKFTKGIKHSLTSVFITKKGSILTAVCCIIYIILNVITFIFIYSNIRLILDSLAYIFDFLISKMNFQSNINDFYSFIPLYEKMIDASFYIFVIELICSLIPFVMLCILAFSYYSYIKKVTSELVLAPADNEATRFYTEPQQNNVPQMPINLNGTDFVMPAPPTDIPKSNPINNSFETDFVQAPAPEPIAKHELYENPYVITPNQEQPAPPQNFVPQPVFNNAEPPKAEPTEKICSKCGEKSSDKMNFCPYCGNKL